MNSLFIESYKILLTLNKSEGKCLVKDGIKFDDIKAEEIFLLPTLTKILSIESCDRIGVDLYLRIDKSDGYIVLNFHKKRKSSCHMYISDTNGKILHEYYKDSLESNLLIDCLLAEYPNFIKQYIITNMSKKWKDIHPLCIEAINEEKKIGYDLSIFVYAGLIKQFTYYNNATSKKRYKFLQTYLDN